MSTLCYENWELRTAIAPGLPTWRVTATRKIGRELVTHRILLHAKSRRDAKAMVLDKVTQVEKITASIYR